MSENEKRLRERIAARMGRRDAEQALRDLDALLAEHRAEVEALERRAWVQCTTTSNECLGGCRSMREHDAYVHGVLVSELESLRPLVALHEDMTRLKREAEQERDAARDAALEDGIHAIDEAFEKDLDVYAQDVLRDLKAQPATEAQTRCECGHMDDVHHSRGGCAACGCAQYRTLRPTSQPAERYLRESEVREVLAKWKGHPFSGDAWTCQRIADELGVDIDADAQS